MHGLLRAFHAVDQRFLFDAPVLYWASSERLCEDDFLHSPAKEKPRIERLVRAAQGYVR